MSAASPRLIVLYETEDACRARLEAEGITPEVAAEIAFYLRQATDFAHLMPEVAAALDAKGIELAAAPLDPTARWLPWLTDARAARTLLWCLTDGFAWYRGSHVGALARLLGVRQFGSPPQAQHLAQDKALCLAAAASAGLRTPPTLLVEDTIPLGPLATLPPEGPWFVKPNTLGAKLGIDDASRAADLDAAFAQTRRIWQRYRDRALIQPYLAGSDVRVSFMDLGHEPPPLGIHRVMTSAPTGYPTLDDSLRMSRLDAPGTSDGLDVTVESLAGTAPAAAIEQAARHLAKVLRLRHYWSMDFRLDPAGRPWLLELEVCPAVTIYDFRIYLREAYGLELAEAIAEAARSAFARRTAPGAEHAAVE